MVRKVNQWAAISGDWSFRERSAKFKGAGAGADGIALSPAKLRSGRISVSMRLSDPERCVGRILLGYDTEDEHHYSVGLGGHESAYGLVRSVPVEGKRESLAAKGRAGQLDGAAWHYVEVELRGKSVVLKVDRIEVIKEKLRPPIGTQIGLLASGDGVVEFRDYQFEGISPRAFVVMQFEDTYDNLYKEVIAPVCERSGFEVKRADDIFRPGVILEDIIGSLVDSDVVIAEISPSNANVFYELGYAHALDKPTVLLARRGGMLPFDVRGNRVIFYDDTIGGKSEVEATLDKHLASIRAH